MTDLLRFLFGLLGVAMWLLAVVAALMSALTAWLLWNDDFAAIREGLPPWREWGPAWFSIVAVLVTDPALWMPALIAASGIGFVCIVRFHLSES